MFGKRKKDKKKFKDTKVGVFLKDKFPAILDIADDYLPPLKILTTLISPIVKDEEVNEIRNNITIPNRVTNTLSNINLNSIDITTLTKLYKEDFDMKKTRWYLSKTVWSAVLIIVMVILKSQGVDVPDFVIVALTAAGLLSARFPNKKINKLDE